MKCSISLIFFVFSFAVFAEKTLPKLDPEKFTICAITINSDNERNLFEIQAKRYQQAFNPIVELTDLGHDDWFENACNSGIRCDQLIISGHFGGSFLGSSGKSLSLSTLESKGCSKSCEGILGHPYEVFLFGCNTLATKEIDGRTPEQYLEVLLRDGIQMEEAEMIIESRYGVTGDSIESSMKRAFGGGPKRIYGFHSIGPSGVNAEGSLKKYFGKINNYRAYLNRLRAKRAMGRISKANKEIAAAFNRTYFAQCTTGSEEKDKITEIICGLQNENYKLSDKAMLVTEAFTHENYSLFIPSIDEFLKKHPEALEMEEIKNLSKNEVLKKQFQGLITKSNFLLTAVGQMSLAKKLGFITPEEEGILLSERVNKLLRNPLSINDKDALCLLPREAVQKINLDEGEILLKEFKKEDYLALACLAESVKTKQAHLKLADGLNDSSPEVRIGVAFAFKEIKTQDGKIQLKLAKRLNDKDARVRRAVVFALGESKPQDTEVQLKLIEILYDPNKYVRIAAANAFWDIKSQDIEVQMKLAEGLKDPVPDVRLVVALALGESKPKNRDVQLKLAEGLNDIDSKVRHAVANALRESRPLHEEVQKMLNKDL